MSNAKSIKYKLRERLNRIPPFAELDKKRWEELLDEVEKVLSEDTECEVCKCGHKKKYHSQDVNSQKYVCRGTYCNCLEFASQDSSEVSNTLDKKQSKVDSIKDSGGKNDGV